MPRHYKKKTRKRRYRRRRTDFNKMTGGGITSTFPIGARFTYRTRYVELAGSLNPGTGGTAATYVYSLNGLFDPDNSGGGHQPMGFDQLMLMYDHYTVVGARARVIFQNTDDFYTQTVAVHIKDTNTVGGTLQGVIENGRCRWGNVSPEGSNSEKTITMNFSPKSFFSKDPMSDSVYRGSVSANPTEGAFLHVVAQPLSAIDTAPVKYSIVIEYVAILTEPKVLTGS